MGHQWWHKLARQFDIVPYYISISIFLSIYLSICRSLDLSIYLSICLSIYQYTILQKNKLDWNTQQSKTILSYRNYLLKTGWPIPKSIYDIHNPKGLTLLNRLKVGLSHLNLHKFNHSFRDHVNLLCLCSLEIESPFEKRTDIRKTFFKGMLRRNIEHFLKKNGYMKN